MVSKMASDPNVLLLEIVSVVLCFLRTQVKFSIEIENLGNLIK